MVSRRTILKSGGALTASLLAGRHIRALADHPLRPAAQDDFPGAETPFDGAVGLWHWNGNGVAERSLEEVVESIKTYAPHVRMVIAKTHDGVQWQGTFDNNAALAINGPEDVERWVRALEPYALEFHAWGTASGLDVDAEAAIIQSVCQVPGVRSMILDVEPYQHFWEGAKNDVIKLMDQVRANIPDRLHLGIAVDPRAARYDDIYPDAWQPYIDSVHPLVYSELLNREPEDVLQETFDVWSDFGKPMYPVLDASESAPTLDTAYNNAIQRYFTRGLSWWRLGLTSTQTFQMIAESADLVERFYAASLG